MAKRLHVSGSGSSKVPEGAEYVGIVKQIQAQKGSKSNWPYEFFKHDSSRGNKLYKVRAVSTVGAVKIYDRLERVILKSGSIEFTSGKVYGLKNGNVLLVTNKGKFLLVGTRPLWDMFNYPE